MVFFYYSSFFMPWTHLGEGGTENPRIEVEVDFSLEAEVPALPRKGTVSEEFLRDSFLRQMFHKYR